MKPIDLSDRLKNEKPKIKIDDTHTFEVQNSKNVVILMDEISKAKDIPDFAESDDKTEKIIEAALGKTALEYLKTLDLSAKSWSLIIEAIMAAVDETPLEEIEKETARKTKDFRK